jgi:hypothetical protein
MRIPCPPSTADLTRQSAAWAVLPTKLPTDQVAEDVAPLGTIWHSGTVTAGERRETRGLTRERASYYPPGSLPELLSR